MPAWPGMNWDRYSVFFSRRARLGRNLGQVYEFTYVYTPKTGHICGQRNRGKDAKIELILVVEDRGQTVSISRKARCNAAAGLGV